MGFDLAGKDAVNSAETELPHTFRKSPESLTVRSAVEVQRLRTSLSARAKKRSLLLDRGIFFILAPLSDSAGQ
jgi:hypothetical protein